MQQTLREDNDQFVAKVNDALRGKGAPKVKAPRASAKSCSDTTRFQQCND